MELGRRGAVLAGLGDDGVGPRAEDLWAACRSWKRRRNGLTLRPPEGMQPCPHLAFRPVRPVLTSDLQNCKMKK